MAEVADSSLHPRHDDLETSKRLACQSCQRRKIKCDRDDPCLACRKNGRQCIPIVDQRLPRGFAGGRRKKATDLSNRVEKLEGLVKSLRNLEHPGLTLQGATDLSGKSATSKTDGSAPPSQYQYLGGAFWTSLQDELSKLSNEINSGKVNEETIEDLAEDARTPVDGSSEDSPSHFDPVFGMVSNSILLQHPLPMLKNHLCNLYFQNVDPVFKVLHAPSVRVHVELGHPYLDYSGGHSAVAALVFVMYYAAVSTMTEDECANTLWQPKQQLMQQFRVMAEAALVQADYIVTTDLTTLQAFVIYLAVLRNDDRSRRTWTMAALAVRIALAIGLQTDRPGRNAFETEQRRRLWHALCVLDLQLAVDLASDRLITQGKSETPLPMNINDADIAYDLSTMPLPRTGWTDMTCSLMAQVIAKEADRSHCTDPELKEERYEIIQALGRNLESQYLAYCDTQVPLQAFAAAATRSTVAACRLHSIRGTNVRFAKAMPAPEKTSLSISSEDVLSMAVDVLSLSQECVTNPLMTGWRWVLWTQWHALAVAFASLSFIIRGDLADRAWNVVEAAFQHLNETVATGQQAQICRPLEKLAQRARRARVNATLPDLQQLNNTDGAVNVAENGFGGLDGFFPDLTDPMMGDWAFLDEAFVPLPDQTVG